MAVYNGIEKYMFSDAYNIYTKYVNMQIGDDNWGKCLEEINIYNFKYKNHPMARQLSMAVLNQLEHVVNKEPINGLSREQWEENLALAHRIGL